MSKLGPNSNSAIKLTRNFGKVLKLKSQSRAESTGTKESVQINTMPFEGGTEKNSPNKGEEKVEFTPKFNSSSGGSTKHVERAQASNRSKIKSQNPIIQKL